MPTKKEIIEGNRMIAEFDGAHLSSAGHILRSPKNHKAMEHYGRKADEYLQYHSSWDWLMPVVAKCHTIDAPTADGWRKSDRIVNCIPANAFERNSIEEVWSAVVKFIEWYNQQNKK